MAEVGAWGVRGWAQGLRVRASPDLAPTWPLAREQACAALFNLARCGTLTRELEARPRDFSEAVQGLVAVLKVTQTLTLTLTLTLALTLTRTRTLTRPTTST